METTLTTTEDVRSDGAAMPSPGIHENIPFAEYAAWPAVNKSSLDWMFDYSPLHCRFHASEPDDPTDALLIGRACHTLVLQPEHFDSEFLIATQCVGVTKKGIRCSKGGTVERDGLFYCSQHAPEGDSNSDSILSVKERDLVYAMRDSLMFTHQSRKFIERPGQNELSIIWQDSLTGLHCKARIDMVRSDGQIIADLKTTTDASLIGFSKSIGTYAYHRQAAFYLRGRVRLDCRHPRSESCL